MASSVARQRGTDISQLQASEASRVSI